MDAGEVAGDACGIGADNEGGGGGGGGGEGGGGGGVSGGGGGGVSAERSCVDLLRVLQHRGEAEAKDFVRRAPCSLLTLQPSPCRAAASNRIPVHPGAPRASA